MMFKIETGVAIPPMTRGGRETMYPFKEMAIGDSFYVPLRGSPIKTIFRLQNSILGSARRRRYPGKQFSTRAEGEGVRCWRIK